MGIFWRSPTGMQERAPPEVFCSPEGRLTPTIWSTTIDHYAKDDRPGELCPSCSFYHDPLRHQLLHLIKIEAHIHKLSSNSFSEPV